MDRKLLLEDDKNLLMNSFKALRYLQRLPLDFLDRVPTETWMEMGANEKDWDVFYDALEKEVSEKTDVLHKAIVSLLEEHRNSFWYGFVIACVKAGREDIIALSPLAEGAAAVLQAKSLLRKDKPPE